VGEGAIVSGTRLAHGACVPSRLAGEGRDGGRDGRNRGDADVHPHPHPPPSRERGFSWPFSHDWCRTVLGEGEDGRTERLVSPLRRVGTTWLISTWDWNPCPSELSGDAAQRGRSMWIGIPGEDLGNHGSFHYVDPQGDESDQYSGGQCVDTST
jgi:hypothetical protein